MVHPLTWRRVQGENWHSVFSGLIKRCSMNVTNGTSGFVGQAPLQLAYWSSCCDLAMAWQKHQFKQCNRFQATCTYHRCQNYYKKIFSKLIVRGTIFCNYYKTLLIELEKMTKYNTNSCFRELFCDHFGQDGNVMQDLAVLRVGVEWRLLVHAKAGSPGWRCIAFCRPTPKHASGRI